jgi:hypothetical protein
MNPITVEGQRAGKPAPVLVIWIEGMPVAVETAQAYLRMRDAAAKEGVPLKLLSGWRSNDEQAAIFDAYQRGTGPFAFPSGYSRHQDGAALDLILDDSARAWLERNAGDFGFSRTIPIEPWHWELTHRQAGQITRSLPDAGHESASLGIKVALGLGVAATVGLAVWSRVWERREVWRFVCRSARGGE